MNIAAEIIVNRGNSVCRKFDQINGGLYSYPGRFYYQWENKTIRWNKKI